jgi:cell wall-associated NlpC family hydrolase
MLDAAMRNRTPCAMKVLAFVSFSLLVLFVPSASANDVSANSDNAAPATVETSIRANDELVFHALAFLGVKYRFGGNDPETGWDCSGYVSHVFKQAIGVMLPRDSFSMSARGEPVARDALQPGDLVFFNTLKRAFSHVGIYLGENRFIHAPSTGKAVQISDMNAGYWSQRFNGGRRIAAHR